MDISWEKGRDGGRVAWRGGEPVGSVEPRGPLWRALDARDRPIDEATSREEAERLVVEQVRP